MTATVEDRPTAAGEAGGAGTVRAPGGTRAVRLVRLVRPALADGPVSGPGAPVVLDPVQQEVADRVVAGVTDAGAGHLLVLGAPGSGRTTVLLEAAVAAVAAGLPVEELLVLAATRRAAADLRDRLAARLRGTAGRPLVQTPAAAAFAVLRARAAALGERPPTLVSGPEQDLVIAELLEGHAAGEGRRVPWPTGVPAEPAGVRAFRDELRDLLMRAAERGLGPADLAALGRRLGRPEWEAAAAVHEEYLDVLELRSGTPDLGPRFDPAAVVAEAARALARWSREVPGVAAPRRRLVLVDDHQESTAATAQLLARFAADGARVVLAGDPDIAVQTFRGALPSLVGRAAVAGGAAGELGATTLVLPQVWRHGAAVRAVVQRVTERVPTAGVAAHRAAPSATSTATSTATRSTTSGTGGVVPAAGTSAGPAADAGLVRAAVLPSAAQEAAWVVHALRAAHHEDGVPWQEMAVVAPTGARVAALRRALVAGQVPVAVLGADVPLREEPAVRPLLEATRVALGADPLDADTAARLLQSPLGGVDAVGLRRLRRALRAEELAAGGGRSSDALLVEALLEPGTVLALPSTVTRPVLRVAAVLAAGAREAARPDADARTVLWAVWEAAGLAETWRAAALGGGVAAERADRDLDAVVALFRAAETFVERMPQSPPASFTDWLVAQDLPADSLAARGRRAAVSVLTPAGASAREWEVVVVVGVQDGVWPDLRLRDSLLGAQALVDHLAGRATAATDPAAARAAVLGDELRSFALACSRARRTLLVTAVSGPDDQPSPLLDLVQPPAPGDDAGSEEKDVRVTSAPSPWDLRGVVARLRRRLEEAAAAGAEDPVAARALARLAAHGVAGADPAGWAGRAAVSSDAPLWAPGERVPVSPSRLETAHTCALRWALESAGGTAGDSGQQSLGTLVHAIAQDHPRGTHAELAAALDARFEELGLGSGWPALATRRKAERMVERLAAYLRDGGTPVAVEAPFRVETDRAVVRGTIDRVEQLADGSVRVVDLKTGSAVPTAAEAAVNPQLGAYQLALDAGAVPDVPPGAPSAGARLVHLAHGSAAPTCRDQQPLADAEDPAWSRALVDEVAERMAASAFDAAVNRRCDRCPVRRSCPARPEGAQVAG
ncbi:UrvD/REP family ATP-dependent DNA helicase [Cellulomonas marina]|uniref:UrvD/REP family ATP-dependent DNA helicase n=1 Tax=Cellulomonas marina TaxID=988821 RepID=UPI001EF29F7C|nr:UrvD/REP family ATP-dependent DNA helicase [Cellulomonas marina]